MIWTRSPSSNCHRYRINQGRIIRFSLRAINRLCRHFAVNACGWIEDYFSIFPHLTWPLSKAFLALSKSGQVSRLWCWERSVLWVCSRRPSSTNTTISCLFSKITLFMVVSHPSFQAAANFPVRSTSDRWQSRFEEITWLWPHQVCAEWLPSERNTSARTSLPGLQADYRRLGRLARGRLSQVQLRLRLLGKELCISGM